MVINDWGWVFPGLVSGSGRVSSVCLLLMYTIAVQCFCLMETTMWKCGDGAVGSCWWTVVAGWYFLTVPICKYVEDRLTGEAESGVWVARARTWQSGNPNGSRIGYLPGLILCRLLLLNLAVRGEHLTSQLYGWLPDYYSHVCLVYLVDELVLVFLTPYNWANSGSVNFFCAWWV